MEYKALISPSLTDLFIDEIEKGILSGQLKIGEKLPTERELSQKMKVSRAVVNGGLNKLAAKGFIRIVPRQGAFVNDYIADGNMDVLTAILNYNSGRISQESLRPIFQFRRSIEPYFAGETAAHLNAHTHELLDPLEAECRNAEDMSPEDAGNLVFRFFHAVALASGNNIHPLLVKTFEPMYESIGAAIARAGHWSELNQDLINICSAIMEGSKEKAIDAEMKHNDHCEAWLTDIQPVQSKEAS